MGAAEDIYILDEGVELISGSSANMLLSVLSNATGAYAIKADGVAKAGFTSAADNSTVQFSFSKDGWGGVSGIDAIGSWNLSGSDNLAFDFGFPPDPSQFFNYVRIYFKCDVAETDYTNCFASGNLEVNNIMRRQELRIMLKSDFTAIGAADWDDVKQLTIVYEHFSGGRLGSGEIHLRSFNHGLKFQPYVVISDDDLGRSFYDEGVKGNSSGGVGLESLGILAMLYPNSGSIGLPGFCTKEEIKEMVELGFPFGNQLDDDKRVALNATFTSSGTTCTAKTVEPHGRSIGEIVTASGNTPDEYNGEFEILTVPSPTELTFTITDVGDLPAAGNGYIARPLDEYKDNINANTDYGIENGFTDGNGDMSFSFGASDKKAVEELNKPENWSVPMRTACTTVAGTGIFEGVDFIPPGYRHPSMFMQLHRVDAGLKKYTGLQLLAMLDNAIARGGIFHVYFHELILGIPTLGTEYPVSEWLVFINGVYERITNGPLRSTTTTRIYDLTTRARVGVRKKVVRPDFTGMRTFRVAPSDFDDGIGGSGGGRARRKPRRFKRKDKTVEIDETVQLVNSKDFQNIISTVLVSGILDE